MDFGELTAKLEKMGESEIDQMSPAGQPTKKNGKKAPDDSLGMECERKKSDDYTKYVYEKSEKLNRRGFWDQK